MTAIVNTKLVLTDALVWNGVILFDNGIITGFGPAETTPVPEGCEVIDAGGLYTGPGFVDIHNHGGGGYWFHEEPEKAAAHFLSHG